MKKILSLILAFTAVILCFASCGSKNSEDTYIMGSENDPANKPETTSAPVELNYDDAVDDAVKVEMSVKDYGIITLELYPNIAPITVENFVGLVNDGFYDGLTFHRIDDDFMIQGGDPEGTGMGGSEKQIKGEFTANGYNNPLSHDEGVISMARSSQSMDSASSQFFICLSGNYKSSLDGQYASFGKVIEGMDVVHAIGKAEVTDNGYGEKSKPVVTPVIEYVKVVD